MTIAVPQTATDSNTTFAVWLYNCNLLANAMSGSVVTVNSNTATGNAAISGTFSASILTANTITSSGAAVNVVSVPINVLGNSSLGVYGVSAFHANTTFDSVGLLKIATGSNANTRMNFLQTDAGGNLVFSGLTLAVDELSDSNTVNVAAGSRANSSIMMWNSAISKWTTNTILVIAQTAITTLTLTNVSSTNTSNPWISTGDTRLGTNAVCVVDSTKRVGIGIITPGVSLDVSGAIRATGDITSFYTSDITFKDNVKAISAKQFLANINELNVVRFDWNAERIAQSKLVDPQECVGADIGLIAQQVRDIAPDLVKERSDGTLAINYIKMIPRLIGAIQELSTEVDMLRRYAATSAWAPKY
jgi:hypothetical protein